MRRLLSLPRLFLADPTWFEIVSVCLLGAWAVILAVPGETFAVSPTYRAMAIVPETIWALGAFLFSAIGLIGLASGKRQFRATALRFAVFFWGTIAACALLASPLSTGGGVYLCLFVLSAIALILHYGR